MSRPACDHEWTEGGEQVWDRVCRRCVIGQREARIAELEASKEAGWALAHSRLEALDDADATIEQLRKAAAEVELMDNSISSAATVIKLRRERDEARAAVKRVRKVAEGAGDHGMSHGHVMPEEVGLLADAVLDALDPTTSDG